MNRAATETKALLTGWMPRSVRHPTLGEGLTLTRDDWAITIAFDGPTATGAVISLPGDDTSHPIDTGMVGVYLRGNRVQMAAFRIGDRVTVGGRAGRVANIIPDGTYRVRLAVAYDDGSMGRPYTTLAQPEEATV